MISRRSFFTRGAVAGIAVAAAGVTRSEAKPTAVDSSFELEEATITELQRAMAAGDLSSRGIVRAYIDRIEKLDRRGPTLNQVLETNPDALTLADTLDDERREGRLRGPLHGIPILVKDNIGTRDRLTTTAGSLALEGMIAPRDAFLIRRLRSAGAIILGKTNLSEWANFRSTQSSSGWSGRGGQGKNPYALDRSPCGSSSGSAAATAANFCAAAIGTETDGSVVCPSSINGIVGIKPTLGLVSRSGVIPLAHSQDTAGPMARTVADAAALLGAIAGVDPGDDATAAAVGRIERDYPRFCDPDGLRGARIGVARERFFGYSPETDAIVESAIEAIKSAGATVVDPADIPNVGEYNQSEFDVLLYEFKDDLNRYLESLGPEIGVRSLADLIEFNERHRDREMPYFGQEIFVMAQEKGPLTDKKYRKALEKNHKLSRVEGIDAVLAEHRLDAVVAPTGSPAWPIDLINGDHFLGASSTPSAVSGYPNITVPAGFSFGLPVGISFIGAAYSEPTLIRLASGFEATTQFRRPPTFRDRAVW